MKLMIFITINLTLLVIIRNLLNVFTSLKFLIMFFGLIIILRVLNFTKKWNHLILILLTLETMILTVSVLLGIVLNLKLINLDCIFIFFTLAVCEASLGIAMVIFFARQHGREFLSSFSN